MSRKKERTRNIEAGPQDHEQKGGSSGAGAEGIKMNRVWVAETLEQV